MQASSPASHPRTDRPPADIRDRLRAQIDGLLTARGEGGPRERRAGAPAAFADARTIALRPGTHEWFAGQNATASAAPPLAMLIDLAWSALERGDGPGGHPGRVLWIGRACRPYPRALIRWSSPDAVRGGPEAGLGDRRLLERSVFVEAGRETGEGGRKAALRERVWAIEQAARCAGVACVIADGRGIGMGDSRRLQLAASDPQGGARGEDPGRPVWLVRPPAERGVISAARTRWIVEPRAPDPPGSHGAGAGAPLEETGETPMEWAVGLMRCKGVRPSSEDARRWAVRREHGTGAIDWRTDTRWAPGAQSGKRSGKRPGGPAGDVGLAAHAVDGPGRAARTA